MIPGFDIIDLSYQINENIPTWEGNKGFEKKTVLDYPASVARVMHYSMVANAGTHIDSPSHFTPQASEIHHLNLSNLCVPIHLIDVRAKAHTDYMISLEDIAIYEQKYGPVRAGSIIIGLTGWDKHWADAKKYRAEDLNGDIHCPGFAADVGPFVLERNVVGLGIDTFSPDGSDMTFPLHLLLLGKEKYLIENLTNLSKVPPVGAYLIALPLKIEGAAESPIRAIALVPQR